MKKTRVHRRLARFFLYLFNQQRESNSHNMPIINVVSFNFRYLFKIHFRFFIFFFFLFFPSFHSLFLPCSRLYYTHDDKNRRFLITFTSFLSSSFSLKKKRKKKKRDKKNNTTAFLLFPFYFNANMQDKKLTDFGIITNHRPPSPRQVRESPSNRSIHIPVFFSFSLYLYLSLSLPRSFVCKLLRA